jgi:hypothetical protein
MMADAMRSLLRHRDFRLLFAGQLLSTLGDRIVIVALALYVTQIGTPTGCRATGRRRWRGSCRRTCSPASARSTGWARSR